MGVVFPTVSALLAWYIQTRASERRFKESIKANPSELSGSWNGVHLTRDDKLGSFVLSRHVYDFDVSSTGEIKGTCEELSASPTYKYGIKGQIRHGGIFLFGEIKTAPSYTWLYNLFNLDRIPGFIFSYDFDNKPFVSYILLSKRNIEDKEYFDWLRRDSDKFYWNPTEKR